MCTMAINQELNGIELTFEGKPAEEIREAMKAAVPVAPLKKLMYAKNTADRMELAEKLSGSSAAPGTDSGSKKIRTGFKVRHQSWRHPDRLMGIRTNKRGVLSGNKDHQRLQIEIVELGHIETETNSAMSGYVIPDQDSRIGDPIQKTVSQDSYEKANGGWHVKISSCISLTPWDGQPCFQSSWY